MRASTQGSMGSFVARPVQHYVTFLNMVRQRSTYQTYNHLLASSMYHVLCKTLWENLKVSNRSKRVIESRWPLPECITTSPSPSWQRQIELWLVPSFEWPTPDNVTQNETKRLCTLLLFPMWSGSCSCRTMHDSLWSVYAPNGLLGQYGPYINDVLQQSLWQDPIAQITSTWNLTVAPYNSETLVYL